MRLLVFIVAVAALLACPCPAQDGLKRTDAGEGVTLPYAKVHVLCVGWNNYQSSSQLYQDLSFAERDAAEVSKLLKTRYGYECKVLNSSSGREALLAQLREYKNTLTAEDVFVFFFAGHGETVQTPVTQTAGGSIGFVVPPDAGLDEIIKQKTVEVRGEREKANKEFREKHPDAKTDEELAKAGLPESAKLDPEAIRSAAIERVKSVEVYEKQCIRTSAIRDLLSELPAKHVVMFFDSCFSGFAVLTERSGSLPTTAKRDELARYRFLTERSRDVVTAGTAGQVTFESEMWGNHGLFTAELLDALAKNETAMTVSELHSKVQLGVTGKSAEQGRKMTPMRLSLMRDQGGQFVFIPPSVDEWRKAVKSVVVNKHGGDLKTAMRKSRELINKSASAARANATLDLLAAMIYDSRVRAGSVKHDPAVTTASPRWIKWFKRVETAAAAGQSESLAALFYAYHLGLGVAPNPTQAMRAAQECRNTADPVGKAVLAAGLSGGVRGSQDEMVRRQLQQDANAGGTALAGATVMAAGADGGRGPALVVGAGVAIAGFLDLVTDSVDKAMADIIKDRDQARKLLSEASGAARDAELEKTLNHWISAAKSMKVFVGKHGSNDEFKNLGNEVCNLLLTRVNNVLQNKASDPAKARADLDMADETVDQLYGLYFLCIEKPRRDAQQKPR